MVGRVGFQPRRQVGNPLTPTPLPLPKGGEGVRGWSEGRGFNPAAKWATPSPLLLSPFRKGERVSEGRVRGMIRAKDLTLTNASTPREQSSWQ